MGCRTTWMPCPIDFRLATQILSTFDIGKIDRAAVGPQNSPDDFMTTGTHRDIPTIMYSTGVKINDVDAVVPWRPVLLEILRADRILILKISCGVITTLARCPVN